ncbi:MAG: hypothetical protein HKN20_07230 [Gemmatimonadetes bacterium]|nr:hypothetical protein [Gemmatimonadota bacterium]
MFTRPIQRGALARAVARARAGGAADPGSLADYYLKELEQELRDERDAPSAAERVASARASLHLIADQEARLRPTVTAAGAIRAHERLTWHQRVEVDRDGLGDSDFLGVEWKHGISGQFTHAYFAIDLDVVRLWLGRRNPAWGVGLDGSSLILQGHSPSFDQVGVAGSIGPLDFTAFTAPLDAIPLPAGAGNLVAGSTTRMADRWLGAHRIAFTIRERLRVGLTETIVYGGPDRGLDWGYANPLLLSYAVQWNGGRNDNPFWSLDFYFHMNEWIDAFGEFLLDDFQYEEQLEPNQIGFLAGTRIKNLPLSVPCILDLEYTRLNNLVYVHEDPWNRYTYGNAALGSPLGPDGDRARARLTARPAYWLELVAEFDHTRKGERTILEPQGEPGTYGGSFLAGEVSEISGGRVRLEWIPHAERRVFGEYVRVEDDWTIRGGGTIRGQKTWNALFGNGR